VIKEAVLIHQAILVEGVDETSVVKLAYGYSGVLGLKVLNDNLAVVIEPSGVLPFTFGGEGKCDARIDFANVGANKLGRCVF
jgi:hypothetical protein